MLAASIMSDSEEDTTSISKSKSIKFAEEQLNLSCQWLQCNAKYHSWEKFDAHLVNHVDTDPDLSACQWDNCNYEAAEGLRLTQHLSYHGYISKLCNIGQNAVDRLGLPECKLQALYLPLEQVMLYVCLWRDCSETFNSIFNFSSHLISHACHSDENESEHKKIECCWTGCNKYFSRPKLPEHLRSHSKEKVIACPTCLTCFSNRTKFVDHRRRQSSASEKNHKCSQCQKLFHTERLLRDHVRLHSKGHPCPLCNMSFSKPSLTAKHYRFKHLQDKHYKCPNCDKVFVTKFNMEAHMRTHGTENAFKCGLCDFSCRSQVGMTNHHVAKHDAIGPLYGCHLCDKRYKRGGVLTKHLKQAHNIEMPDEQQRFEYEKDQDGMYRLSTPRRNVTVKVSLVPGDGVEGNIDYDITYEVGEGHANPVPGTYEVDEGGYANPAQEAHEVSEGYANPVPEVFEIG